MTFLQWIYALTTLGAVPLSLEQAIAQARERAPEVQLAARAVDEATASRVGAGLFLPSNPRLFGDYRPMAIELPGQPSEPRHGYLVGVDGLFEISGAGGARLAEAQKRVEVAQAEFAWERSRAAARAWVAWVDALLADQRLTRVEEALALQKRVAEAARERVATGVAGEPELTTVQVEVASVERDLSEARRRKQATRLALAHVLDAPPDTDWELTPSLMEPREAPREEELLDRALRQRPELALATARLALLESTEGRLTREAIPRLGFNLGLDAAPASPVFGFAGLSVELPVAQRNQGPRAVARAQQETERTRLQAQLRHVAREVAMARQSYEARREQLTLLTRDALPSARRTQELIEQGWRAGRFDIFRLTTTTRDTQRLERELVETLLSTWTDWVELQRVSGGLNP
jgi:cobalt-zinc-cadmium efflux system outer membrane protein